MSETLTRHLVARGRVQGVGFRESMWQEAARLHVTGWVRNRLDGSLEAIVQGPAAAVEAMLAWARRGPDSAHVDTLEVTEASGEFARFEKRYTE
jgi:acylphosphatase